MEKERIRKKSKLSSPDPAGAEKELNSGNSNQKAQIVCNDSHVSHQVPNSMTTMVDENNGQKSELSSPDPAGAEKELNSGSSIQNAQRMLVDEIVKQQKSRLSSADPAGAEEDLSAENISQNALRLWNLSESQDSCELAILLLQACVSTAASHFATYFRNTCPDLRPTLDTLVQWTLISTWLALVSLEEQWGSEEIENPNGDEGPYEEQVPAMEESASSCGEIENPNGDEDPHDEQIPPMEASASSSGATENLNGDEDPHDEQIPPMEESASSSEPFSDSESISDSDSLHSFDGSLDDLLQQLEDMKNEVLLIEESTRMDGDDDLVRQEAEALRWEMDHPRP